MILKKCVKINRVIFKKNKNKNKNTWQKLVVWFFKNYHHRFLDSSFRCAALHQIWSILIGQITIVWKLQSKKFIKIVKKFQIKLIN